MGRYLVQSLLAQGAHVRVTVHQRPLAVGDSRVTAVQADLTQLADCLRAVAGVDYVFHAAGAVGSAAVQASCVMDQIADNLVLTARLVQAAWSEGVKRLLLFSSSTVYPATTHPVREAEAWDAPPFEGYMGYGWMRRYLEKLAEFVMTQTRMKIAVVRPTAIYGPYDNFDLGSCHVLPALMRRAVEKQNPFVVWGNGHDVRDFLHVQDLARGCLLMLEHGATGEPLNIGYGQGVTIRELLPLILEAAGYQQADVQFDDSRPTALPVRRVDTSQAKALLGFEPAISLEKGIAETVAWYMQNQQVKI